MPCQRPLVPAALRRIARLVPGVALAIALFLAAPRADAGNLWIAWDQSAASCQQQTTDFFNCVLNDTNFNQLALAYTGVGEPLTLAGTHVLTTGCSPTDFTCVVNNAGFKIAQYDVVMHYYGSGWVGGTNGAQVVNGVLINTAYVETGNVCDGQTCTGAHEAFEAATNGTSADCCNGQVNSASCPSCNASCGKYAGNNGNPPYGCFDLKCPNGATYKMELLSKAGNQYDASGCTEVTVQGGCTAINQPCGQPSDCCKGLTCEKWSYTGKAPYTDNCCKAIGSSCSANTDCCGGSNCSGGTCGCVPTGQWCINASDCCAGSTCDLSASMCVAAGATSSSAASTAASTASASGSTSSVASTASSSTGAGAGGAGGAAAGSGGANVGGAHGAGGGLLVAATASASTGGNTKTAAQKAGCSCLVAPSDASTGVGGAGLLVIAAGALAASRRRPRSLVRSTRRVTRRTVIAGVSGA